MRIAMFTETYLPYINGIVTHVKLLKEGLESWDTKFSSLRQTLTRGIIISKTESFTAPAPAPSGFTTTGWRPLTPTGG